MASTAAWAANEPKSFSTTDPKALGKFPECLCARVLILNFVPTRLEIVDSAVKIGLGAAITAITTIAVSMLNARHAKKSDERKRRIELIEKLTAEFEQHHSSTIELYSSYATYLDCPNRIAAEMAWTKAGNCLMHKTGPALTALHGLEGRLILIGCGDSVKAIAAYRNALVELQNAVRMIGGSEGPPLTADEFRALGEATNDRRKEVYAALSSDYKNS